ncbi:Tale class homeobox transcription factor pknox, partial [Globisporangium splendens]
MTFPNRSSYTPGEKKRERKYVIRDTKPAAVSSASSSNSATPTSGQTATMTTGSIMTQPANTVVMRTRASGKRKARNPSHEGGETKRIACNSPLQMEMLAALASFSPLPHPTLEAVGDDTTATKSESQECAIAPFLVTKQQLGQRADEARQRLLEDELFQTQNTHNRLLSFTNAAASSSTVVTRSRGGIDAESAFRAAVEWMPVPDASSRSAMNEPMIQNVLVKLQDVKATSMQELEHAMVMIDDASVRQSYQQALGTLQEWGKRKLYLQQQLQQTLRSGFASPLVLSSPSDILLGGAAGVAAARHPVKRRTNLSKTAKTVLRTWFEDHLHHPYPTEEEKEMLGMRGGIAIEQVNNWFINTRGRKWKPMLTRLMAEKEAGECKLYDQMVERIEEPYRRAPTDR